MATDYLTCAQTAALVRKALKESVPDIKFSVRSNTYSGGASIRVVWTDGPNEILVDSVIGHLKASYFDGGIDYRGSIFHMVNGRPVRLGADSINLHREYTDALTELAIGRVYRRLHNAFVTRGIPRPTVRQYRTGALWNVSLGLDHTPGLDNLQQEVGAVLHKISDRMAVAKSKTAASIFVTHDDGYSRSNGTGMSAAILAE